jgi:hypothetical protein
MFNVAPGGPLSGIQINNPDPRRPITEADIARLQSFLGIDKPLVLRYIVWMIGDDWLGADWMSLSLRGHPVDEETRVRFWADPGVAHLRPGYTLWMRGTMNESGVFQASSVEVVPRPGTPLDGATQVRIVRVLVLCEPIAHLRVDLTIEVPEHGFPQQGDDLLLVHHQVALIIKMGLVQQLAQAAH